MDKQQEQALRWQIENEEWVSSSAVKLLLDMIDAARAECILAGGRYSSLGEDGYKAAFAAGEKLGLTEADF